MQGIFNQTGAAVVILVVIKYNYLDNNWKGRELFRGFIITVATYLNAICI